MSDSDRNTEAPETQGIQSASEPGASRVSGRDRRSAAKYGVLMLAASAGSTWCGIRYARTGHDPISTTRPELDPSVYFGMALLMLVIAVALFGVAAGIWKPKTPSR